MTGNSGLVRVAYVCFSVYGVCVHACVCVRTCGVCKHVCFSAYGPYEKRVYVFDYVRVCVHTCVCLCVWCVWVCVCLSVWCLWAHVCPCMCVWLKVRETDTEIKFSSLTSGTQNFCFRWFKVEKTQTVFYVTNMITSTSVLLQDRWLLNSNLSKTNEKNFHSGSLIIHFDICDLIFLVLLFTFFLKCRLFPTSVWTGYGVELSLMSRWIAIKLHYWLDFQSKTCSQHTVNWN